MAGAFAGTHILSAMTKQTEKAASAGMSAYQKARALGLAKWLAAAIGAVAAAVVVVGSQDASAASLVPATTKVLEDAGGINGNCPTPRTCKSSCATAGTDVCNWQVSQATAAGAAQCPLGKCETTQPRKAGVICEDAGLVIPDTKRAA